MVQSHTSTVWVFVLALGAVSPLAAQGAEGPDFWAVTGVRANDALNMRMAPKAESEVIARIPPSARGLKNHGCPNDVTFEQWKRMTKAQRDFAAKSRWCQVEYQGRKGWVAGRFLREDSSAR